MKSALLFRLGGLGDLLVAFPSIHLLRKTLSPCSITLVCREEYGLILKQTGVVDTLISVSNPKLAPLFASPPFPKDIAQWLDGFSCIVGWMQKRSVLKLEEFCQYQDKRRCQSFVYDPSFKGSISAFFFQKTFEFLAEERVPLPSFADCSLLPLSSQQKQDGLKLIGERALAPGEKSAVIHPGSGSERKCWPLDNFLEIIHRLAGKGFRGALVTGPVEERMENKIKKTSLPPRWVWLRNTPLLELAGLLSRASLYLGNDSGISHLAAACGTKVVALFRADLESPWKPYGQASVLSSESVADISPAAVWETVTRISA